MANFRVVDNNLCFMANEKEVISDSEDILTLEELEDAYKELEKNLKVEKNAILVSKRACML